MGPLTLFRTSISSANVGPFAIEMAYVPYLYWFATVGWSLVAKLTPPRLRHECDLRGLRIFLAVCATGSMTVAARRLGLTQSAVSQAVRQLEELLGSILVDRSQRPLALSATGLVLRHHAERLVEDADALTNAVRGASSAKLPELRLGVVDSFASTAGPGLMKALLHDTATRLSFRSGLAHDQSEGLLSRSLDIIITTDALEDLDGLDRFPILSEPFVLLIPAPYPAAQSHADLKRLAAAHPLIRFSARSQMGAQIERHLRRLNIKASRLLEVDATDSLIAMVEGGLGWAVATPLCLMQVRGRFDGVRVLPFPGTGFARQLYVIAQSGAYGDLPERVAAAACEVLRRECQPEIRRMLPWVRNQLVIG